MSEPMTDLSDEIAAAREVVEFLRRVAIGHRIGADLTMTSAADRIEYLALAKRRDQGASAIEALIARVEGQGR